MSVGAHLILFLLIFLVRNCTVLKFKYIHCNIKDEIYHNRKYNNPQQVIDNNYIVVLKFCFNKFFKKHVVIITINSSHFYY